MRRVTVKDAYEVVRAAGNKGLLQSDLWRSLGTNSREGSRIATNMWMKRRRFQTYYGAHSISAHVSPVSTSLNVVKGNQFRQQSVRP
ncbi:MAG: hypothetical protein ACTSQQ_16235 [Candidatus Helarchaeota archaeon]